MKNSLLVYMIELERVSDDWVALPQSHMTASVTLLDRHSSVKYS